MSKYYIHNGTFRAVPEQSDELKHYGVPGMKWGHRKARPQSEVSTARKAYRQAKRDFDRSYNKAYNRSLAGLSPVKKHRQANDARWEDAFNKAGAMKEAKKNLKQAKVSAKTKAKAERALAKIEKQNKKDFIKTRSKEIQKGSSVVGKMWNAYTGGHKIQAEIEYNLRKYKD